MPFSGAVLILVGLVTLLLLSLDIVVVGMDRGARNYLQKKPPFFRRAYSVAVPFLIAIVILLSLNSVAYAYLQKKPPNWQQASAYFSTACWNGVLSLRQPVDTIVLGDSSAERNLDCGPFSDRLGGETINLSTEVKTTFLMDAWLLAEYIHRFGPPRNVVVERTSRGYWNTLDPEHMAAVPLPWGFWDRLGAAPDWGNREYLDLALRKYLPTFYCADILGQRLLGKNCVIPRPKLPSHDYERGLTSEKEVMDVARRLPSGYFSDFSASEDAKAGLRLLSDLARQYEFQLYVLFQPEWDKAVEAGARADILKAQGDFLSQYADPQYVHVLRLDSLVFREEQMQNTSHLRPGPDRIYTEAYLSAITAGQSELTAGESVPVAVDNMTWDVASHAISFEVRGNADVEVYASCLIKPEGSTDGEWVARAYPAGAALGNGAARIDLSLDVGSIDNPGNYSLVVFLRQHIGMLVNETRYEFHNWPVPSAGTT